MGAKEKPNSNQGDWRASLCTSIFQMADLVDNSPGLKQISTNPSTLPENFSESLNLPSTQRLNNLNQVSPMAEKILGFKVTRGQHTEDAMRLTTNFLTHISTDTPELFDQLIADYKLTPDEAIKHCVEYMRLHDLATLAFQGAMHGRVKVGEDNYDEDRALLMAFEKTPAYQPVSDLIFDSETLAFYEKTGIRKDVLNQIADDSIYGKTLLGTMLKKGGECPPVDWLAYTARDFYELTRVFGIENNMPFPQKIKLVLGGLVKVSQNLTKDIPFVLPEKFEETKTIEQLIPPNIIRLSEDNNEVRLVYDGKTIAEHYVMHTILRLFFSGSPWIRGTYRLIFDGLKSTYPDDEVLLSKLLSSIPEKELLEAHIHSRGWGYSSLPTDQEPVILVFKDIGRTLVNVDDSVLPFDKAFPRIAKVNEDIKNQPPLYLQHLI